MLGYEDCASKGRGRAGDSHDAVKKQKFSTTKDEDWDYLCTSSHGKKQTDLNKTLKFTTLNSDLDTENSVKSNINPEGVLFVYIRIIHFTLHLLYEDLKLNVLRSQECLPLMKLLYRLSKDIGLTEYSIYYWRDFPDQVSGDVQQSSLSKNDLNTVICHSGISEVPVSVMKYIYDLMSGLNQQPYPFLRNVNVRSRDIVQVMTNEYYLLKFD